MNTYFKILAMAVFGGLFGGLIRLGIYLMYKTPSIKFDGPAGFSFMLAMLGGVLLFAIVGAILSAKKKS